VTVEIRYKTRLLSSHRVLFEADFMIQFHCQCGKLLQASEDLAGRLTRCPACDAEFSIPQTSAVETVASPPSNQDGFPDDDMEDYDDAARPRVSGRSGKAIVSLLLGISSFVFVFFTGIPAIVMGIVALRDTTKSQGRVRGTGMAITGLVLGVVGCMITVPALLLGLLLPAVQKVREAANRMNCTTNLNQLAVAMHMYHDANGRLPPAAVRGGDGRPLYSWRVLLLPYLGQESLYHQFKLNQPWDSPNNIKLLSQMPKVFLDPSAHTPESGMTVYQVFEGPKTAFEDPRGLNLATFTDGLANTILIAEAGTAVPWTKPADLAYRADGPLPKLGGHHPGGFNVALADGAVRFLSENVPEAVLRAAITRNGNENMPLP